LLRHGADPNIGDDRGLSYLNTAKDNVEVIRQRIESGADACSGKKLLLLDAIESMGLAPGTLLASLGADFNRNHLWKKIPKLKRIAMVNTR